MPALVMRCRVAIVGLSVRLMLPLTVIAPVVAEPIMRRLAVMRSSSASDSSSVSVAALVVDPRSIASAPTLFLSVTV